ncbi:DUF4349 domain-containing protein [Clostridium beijerinckii]|uniref:DUF4349 domain-containing protein n=1 Tax=Clostridium beijerinckii TaxID=1520 RepID=UPI0009CEAFC4|nr:DUF4349 domain-containing protein [Clostridium beijerinckii]NRT78430.1 ppGpp synthetase/RelA/SpoT-type nucleotidyltransferase [Clostridium beijerinckii]NRT78438.1 ppGpp synthetase/RelA/SpoT-type nucleotidyltransferase [Clostridium beijerinckii]OOM35328.1 hypothetical protein CBEIJ_52900 [Clostridium beijerinckii]
MSEGKIIEIYNKGISEVIDVIKTLSNQIKEQNSQIESLTSRVKSLENQVSKIVIIVVSRHRQMDLKRKLKV